MMKPKVALLARCMSMESSQAIQTKRLQVRAEMMYQLDISAGFKGIYLFLYALYLQCS